jgi:hypothetical protein
MRQVILAVALLVVVFPARALSVGPVAHGISFTHSCVSTTPIGQPYACTYSVLNNVDEAQDTLTFTGLDDTVVSAGGPVSSGNVMSSLRFVIGAFLPTFSTPPYCTGGIGTGSDGDPFRSAPGNPLISCSLPFGSRLDVQPFLFYTVQAADFTLLGHLLTDDAELTWHDGCDDPAHTSNTNCVANPPDVGASGHSVVMQLPSVVSSAIHNAAHTAVTGVAVGTTLHDLVTVTGQPGSPVPTSFDYTTNPTPPPSVVLVPVNNVKIDWLANVTNSTTCAGTLVATTTTRPLDLNGQLDATGFSFTPTVAGMYAFQVHFLGDQFYSASDGACEPLRVVDANISISPNGVNRVGQQHTFTAHVNVNDGTGFANAPDGTMVHFTIDGAPSGLSCTTAGGTGSCSVTYTSPVTLVDTVVASTTVSAGGVTLTRATDGTNGSSGPATKRWVNAKISITPSQTGAVGTPDTFTVTLQQDTGDGTGFQPAPGQHVDFTLTNANGANAVLDTAASSCDDAGPNTNANGQCTIVFTSASAGKVTGTATAALSVAGSAPFTVATNGVAPNSGPAVATFVDANIQISPSTATNPAGSNHVLTGHVNVNLGDGGGFVNAPAGTTIAFSLSDAGGATATFVGPSSCTTNNATGSCTVTISSPTGGSTTVQASTVVTVGGVSLNRQTGDTHPGDSGDAMKTWFVPADANISLLPLTVTTPVALTETVTGHVRVAPDGTTFGNAPAGTMISYSLTNAGGATATFVGPHTCSTVGTTGSCAVRISSPTPGMTTVHATTTVMVAGVTLTRATGDGHPGDGPDAVATWESVQQQLDTLLGQVVGVGPGTSLAAKVMQVQAAVAANKKGTACNGLNAFINQVMAVSKSLGPTLTAQLIAEARAIEAGIGC